MTHKITFDMDNQPGIADGAIRRSCVVDAINALGLDPRHVTEVHMRKDDQVEVTALLTSVEGARALGYSGPTKSDDDASGYLKHTYRVPVVDDEEDMSPSEYYGARSAEPCAPDGSEAAARGETLGPTMTESEYRTWTAGWTEDYRVGFVNAINIAGITVVPDPEPTIPLPTEPGARFIAYSPKWSDGPQDQREFVVAGTSIVDICTGNTCHRAAFADYWTVTAIVTAPGGDDDH